MTSDVRPIPEEQRQEVLRIVGLFAEVLRAVTDDGGEVPRKGPTPEGSGPVVQINSRKSA